MISALADEFSNLGRTTVYTIVTEKLGYHKLCARWVPKMLTYQHKEQRMSSGREFLNRYQQDGDDLFFHIVTSDETWISYINPKSKQQSMQWRHSTSPKPKKFKQTPYTSRKMMATVFWDEKGVLLVDFMERGTTITADVYCETLNKLGRAIQNRRRVPTLHLVTTSFSYIPKNGSVDNALKMTWNLRTPLKTGSTRRWRASMQRG
ncbi:hypothetical protein QTP88_026740 [Uroleucon formosanum]